MRIIKKSIGCLLAAVIAFPSGLAFADIGGESVGGDGESTNSTII